MIKWTKQIKLSQSRCYLSSNLLEPKQYVARNSYERQRRGRKLVEVTKQTNDIEARISDVQNGIEKLRDECRAVEKEIHASGAILANLRENARFRKLTKEVKHVNEEIASLDIEGAAKAKRQFESKWATAQEREQILNRGVSFFILERTIPLFLIFARLSLQP